MHKGVCVDECGEEFRRLPSSVLSEIRQIETILAHLEQIHSDDHQHVASIFSHPSVAEQKVNKIRKARERERERKRCRKQGERKRKSSPLLLLLQRAFCLCIHHFHYIHKYFGGNLSVWRRCPVVSIFNWVKQIFRYFEELEKTFPFHGSLSLSLSLALPSTVFVGIPSHPSSILCLML